MHFGKLFYLYLFVSGLANGLAEGMAAKTVACPMPLEQGTQWVYKGKLAWTVLNSARVKSAEIRLTTTVVDCLEAPGVRAAVVCGFPDGLAWYEPGNPYEHAVLISTGNRLYRYSADSRKEAVDLAARLIREPRKLAAATDELLMVFPLAKGRRWAEEAKREDAFYCWHVEDEKRTAIRIDGFNPTLPVPLFTLGYRTQPAHTLIEVIPGIGITRYVYIHHGTVASADVRLVSVKRGAKTAGTAKCTVCTKSK